MAFVKAGVNYATEYQTALNQELPYVLHFGALRTTDNNGKFRWINNRTIEIPTIEVSGRVDADRDTIGTKARRWNNTWTPLTLSNQRMWQTLVHPADIDQTNAIATIANITKVFNEEQKFPEMDAYLISKVYTEWLATGKVPDTDAVTIANVLAMFDMMMQRMSEHRIPLLGRILYVIPAINTILKQAQGLSRTINAQDGNAAVYRAIGSLDTVKIEEVPPELMKTAYDFTEGWAVGASAKQICMALIHPSCVITPVSYETAMLDAPSAGTGGKWDYYEESHEDVFMLATKRHAAEFVLMNATTLPALAFTSTASTGGTDGYTVISGLSPALMSGRSYVYKTHADTLATPTLGTVLDDTWLAWDGEDEIAVTNGYKLGIVEINSERKACVGAVKTAVASAT